MKDRTQDLKDRYSLLSDKGLLQASGITNPDAYFRDEILGNIVPDDAERKMKLLEKHYAENVVVFDYNDRKQRADKVCSQIENILDKTDWLFISDVPVSSSWRQIYKAYRQLLRDKHNFLQKSFNVAPDSEFAFEKFSNYMRRLYPNQFLDGGEGIAMIKKFESKMKEGK